MQDKLKRSEAKAFVESLGPTVPEDLAIRTYSARLLGSESALVLHGGGNTSVKTTWRDRFAVAHEVIAVKASGFDMATISPSGHALLLLQSARRLLAIDSLSDQEMADELRRCLAGWRAAKPDSGQASGLRCFGPHTARNCDLGRDGA